MPIKTASFTMPGIMPPYGAEMAGVQSEQAQLAAALAQLQEQGPARPLNAGKFSALNFDGLGGALREAMLQKKQEVAKKKAADLSGSYQKDLLQGLRSYTSERDGEEVALPGPPEEGKAPPSRQTPGNPLAYKAGQLSQFPEIRGMAGDDRKTQEALFAKLVDKASPNSAFAAGGDPRQLRAKADQKVVNNSVMEMGQEVGEVPKVLPGMGVTQRDVAGVGMSNVQPGGNVDPLDKRNVSHVTLSTGGKADQVFLNDEVKDISANRSKLEASTTRGFRALASAQQAVENGAYMGPVSGFVSGAAGLAVQFGMGSDEVKRFLSETQVLDSDMGRFVLAALKQTGTNPSNADREYAARTAGDKKLSPDGLLAVIRAGRTDIVNDLITHNNRVDQYAGDVPQLIRAKLAIPDLSNVAKGAKGVPSNAQDVSGFLPDPATGMYMPSARPVAAKPPSYRYTPAELERLRKNGITPLE